MTPSVVNLFLKFPVLRWSYKDDFHDAELRHLQEPMRDKQVAFPATISLQIVLVLSVAKIATSVACSLPEFRLTHIALAACLPILVGTPKRWKILRHIDLATLVFFAAMFILMESVWRTGFFQTMLVEMALDTRAPGVVLGVSIVLSQFISNVPLVALYQPILLTAGAGTPELMAPAAGSTIAGNMLILLRIRQSRDSARASAGRSQLGVSAVSLRCRSGSHIGRAGQLRPASCATISLQLLVSVL